LPQKQAEWNILVFMNGKNNLEPFAFVNFDQIAQVGSTDKVNVLVEFGRPHNHAIHSYGAWSKTLRFRVTKGMEPTEASALADLGAVNMGDGAALAEFVTWAQREYPANRTMLVLWDHGQGWRLRSATRLMATGRARSQLLARRRAAREAANPGPVGGLPDDMRLHGSFRYVSHDDDTGDKLYNREIQDTLAALETPPLDVIGFDACLMGMIETGYAMRNVAKVLVGSEELEPGDGWDYQRWLTPLVAAPAKYDAIALGGLIVDAYKQHYGNNADTTLSTVDLAKVPAAATAVSAFADVARSKLGAQLGVLKQARAACATYAPGYPLYSIDLVRFLQEVAGASGVDPGLKKAATSAVRAVKASVASNYASASRKGSYGSNGAGIYFPPSKLEYEHDADGDGYRLDNTLYPVEFVQSEQWAPFLHAYLEKVKT
jgi:hypothetical protein